jgi:hypothetical protein
MLTIKQAELALARRNWARTAIDTYMFIALREIMMRTALSLAP